MSTQVARGPRTAAEHPLSATRQQLDELDALLQRMLDLPVQPGGDEAPPEPRSPQPARREAPPPRPAAPPRKETQRSDPPPSPAPRPQPQRSEPPAPPVPPTPKITSSPRRAPAATEAASPPAEPKAYPASYMVVETTTPNIPRREQSPRSDAPTDAGLGPRIVVHEQTASDEEDHETEIELPVPGGRHDLEADDPVDVAEDLARLQSELSKPPEEWVPFHSSWQPSEQTWKPLAETWEQARKAPESSPTPDPEAEAGQPARMPPERPVPPPDARPRLRDFPRVTMPVAPRPSDAPSPASSPDRQTAPAADASAQTKIAPLPSTPSPPLPALPLVWFNAAFDALLTPFGPPGRWLKGKGGRGVLGAVGLLCLAGAAALAAYDGFGWTL
jgi:hypothetical protein